MWSIPWITSTTISFLQFWGLSYIIAIFRAETICLLHYGKRSLNKNEVLGSQIGGTFLILILWLLAWAFHFVQHLF